MKPLPLSQDEIKKIADRAEGREHKKENGVSAQDFVATALSEGELNVEIAKLAALPVGVYESKRVAEAKRLGMRAVVLDKLVKQQGVVKADKNRDELPHWSAEPSSVPVEGAALLDAMKQTFRRYIVLPKGADNALALWTLHAWTFDAGDISPFMVLVSPTKRCGKTNTLILLLYLTPRSELASNISPSAVFRYVEDKRPTMLFDEGDTFLVSNEEMRGILNSGHTRAGAYVIRNVEVNGEHAPRRFSTWAPKAIATIRKLADTLEDRSIIVQLQRRPRTANVARLRHRDTAEFKALRSKAARWAKDNFAKLGDADPTVPDTLNDRAADNWRSLLAIADLAGGEWPERARETACLLSGDGQDSAANVRLLADIHDAFGVELEIRSAELALRLASDPENPWAEWNRGKPITQRQLARLLSPFGITSEEVHSPSGSHGKDTNESTLRTSGRLIFLVKTRARPLPRGPSRGSRSAQPRNCR
jgi:putative DNA primase/helicase